MARIGHQGLALQRVGKDFFTKRNRLVLVGFVQAMGQPDMLWAFHDEGGGFLVKLVNVRLKPAVLGALKIKSERVVQTLGAQPDEAVGPRDDVGFEHVGMQGANTRIDAIRGNHQIGVRVLSV